VLAGVDARLHSIAVYNDNSSHRARLFLFWLGRISPRVRGAPIRTDGGRDACPWSYRLRIEQKRLRGAAHFQALADQRRRARHADVATVRSRATNEVLMALIVRLKNAVLLLLGGSAI
jgi:hypothetical protein